MNDLQSAVITRTQSTLPQRGSYITIDGQDVLVMSAREFAGRQMVTVDDGTNMYDVYL
jgi:hypothetical protein